MNTFYCQPELDGDVISGRNVKKRLSSRPYYAAANFEFTIALVVCDIFQQDDDDGDVGDGSGGVNAICSRLHFRWGFTELSGTFLKFVGCLQENRNQPFV